MLEKEKIEERLNEVLKVLYSDNRIDFNYLNEKFNFSYDIDSLKYHLVFRNALKLRRSFTSIDIDNIYKEQMEMVKQYDDASEIGKKIILNELMRQTQFGINEFNKYMGKLRRADPNSVEGKIYAKLIAKGGPITENEENN